MKILGRATLIPIILLLWGFCPSPNQGNDTRFSVFIIHEIDDISDCRSIDSMLRALPQIQMSRADLNTKRVYCIYQDDSGVDEQWFSAQLNALEFNVSCYQEGVRGVDPFPAITHEQCHQ